MSQAVSKPKRLGRMPITGLVRRLEASDQAALASHLQRLERQDRHERFNGSVNDQVIADYASNALSSETLSFGYFEGDEIRGACELRPGACCDLYEAELAFSIEAPWKRRGIGSRLLGRVLGAAQRSGLGRIGFSTDPQNTAMKALARKFGAKMNFLDGQTIGVFTLNPQHNAVIPQAKADTPKPADIRREAIAQFLSGVHQVTRASTRIFRR